jgi:hypothetical protein
MSVGKSITLLTLLLSVSAAPLVAADVAGGLVAGAALPPTICDLSNVRAAVADANALVDKGDLAAARTSLKDLDKFWDGAVASSSPQTVTRWRVIDRAIDRGLDRASWLFDHIGQMRPWATKRSWISSLSSIRCAEKIKRTPMEDAYDRRRLLALWPSNHYHRCLGMILTYRRYQRTFNSVLTLASLNVEIVVSS